MSDVSERAEAMLAKITPGPWGVDSGDYPDDNAVYSDGIERYITERVNNPDDAEFIAASPDLVAGLLAERDAALARAERAEAALARVEALLRDPDYKNGSGLIDCRDIDDALRGEG